MKRNVILIMATMIFVIAITSINLFAQSIATSTAQANVSAIPLTDSEALANILADTKRIPLILYPPGHLERLKEIGDNLLPISTKVKRSPHSINRMGMNGPNGPSPMDLLPVYDYQVVDLGTLGGTWSVASAINASGQVVGTSYTSGNNSVNAFLYSGNSIHDLGSFNGNGSTAYGINASSKIVGYSYTTAFMYDGSFHSLGTLGGIEAVANGINASGQIAGFASITGNTSHHAFLYSGGSMQDIDTLTSSGNDSLGYGINDSGDIAGYFYTNNNVIAHSFFYSDGLMEDIGVGPYVSTYAMCINGNDQIAGFSVATNTGYLRAFLYDGSFTDLGMLGSGIEARGLGINSSGEVVGYSQILSGGNIHAFIYLNGGIQDLNNMLVPTNSGWTLQQANGINDAGQIVGYGINPSGQAHAFLLNPLPLGWRQAMTNQPSQLTYGIPPTKDPTKDSLVVITHGWNPTDMTWLDDMTNIIKSYITSHGLANWQVASYKWIENASTGILPSSAQKALNNAKGEGENLGLAIASEGWSHVHLIAHSAGAEVIQVACEWIKTLSPTTTVHCTFLDPFVGFDYAGVSRYGDGADWAENYFSRDINTHIGGWFTEGPFTESLLDHAYNVDVTLLDPNKHVIGKFHSSTTGEMEPCTETFTSHEWPINFYTNTIVGNVTSSYAGFGFPLSKEGGNWNYALANYTSGNNPAQILGTPDPSCIEIHDFTPPSWVNTLIDFTQSPTIQSDTGTIQKWFDSLKLFSGSPAWLATVVSSTNPVNVVSFDAEFASNDGAQGLLSVVWDDQVIGSIDERVIVDTNHYSFKFPNATANSSHILGFRLDPFTNIQSIVIVTNVALNQVGVSQPFSLALTGGMTNGARVYELTGEVGFEYHVQASTNLVDWTDISTLANTNGAVRFFDQSSTNSPMKFYRGVAPY